ncbi:MAG: hypothetical protein M1829_001682 [Trizodia sp. TS-e1964]|nr:MAG: hypothetical protein M1829_001682 [Trizodia sp. TS-e1964]
MSTSLAIAGTNSALPTDIKIDSTDLQSAPGAELDGHQKVLVGSVLDVLFPLSPPPPPLDRQISKTPSLAVSRPPLAEETQLMEGLPSIHPFVNTPSQFSLNAQDDAVFEDPLTIANGRREYSAQWYGLASVFSNVERLSHRITSAGNPMTIDLSSKYKVKGLGKEVTIDSTVFVFVDSATGKISKVQDKWNGTLPDGAIKNAFRRLNAVSVPIMVSVPKNEEEDAKYQK